MVHIRNFGWRLGNQLFQLAAAISLASENYDSVCYPSWKYANKFVGAFNHPPEGLPGRVFVQNGHHYSPIPYEPNIVIDGYFQSEKYFLPSQDLIRMMFALRDPVSFNDKISCSIHIRLGDYLTLPNHHPIKTWDNYYEGAIVRYMASHNYSDTIYRVFSDDIARARKILPIDRYKFDFVDCEDEITAFGLMSSCRDNIIGNSSYSWWAAWLNPNPAKTVIAPKEWFGPAYSHLNIDDMIPSTWITK